ncbi:MAG: hypothetical protein ACXW11_10005 [Methylotenera sp.]
MKYLIVALYIFSAPAFAEVANATQNNDSKHVNKMMTVKSYKGEDGITIKTDQGTYIADAYHLGKKGFNLVLMSKKNKTPICFNDIFADENNENSGFFEDVQLTCDK